jgi:hypothetical protein
MHNNNFRGGLKAMSLALAPSERCVRSSNQAFGFFEAPQERHIDHGNKTFRSYGAYCPTLFAILADISPFQGFTNYLNK